MAERKKPEHQAETQRAAVATDVAEREPQRRDVEVLQLQRMAAALRTGSAPPASGGPALLALQRHAGNGAMVTALRPAKHAPSVQRVGTFFDANIYDNPANKKQKAANVAAHLGEGVVNSLLAPVNPRWWYKAYTDIAEIKASDYGDSGSKIAKTFAVLAGTSQVLQKVATIAGIVSLLASIAGAVTGGAAVAVGAVAGFIAMLASGLAATIQLILMLRNAGSLSDDDRKKRFFADLASFIGSALGAVAGGIGTNFGDAGVAGAGAAVTDKFIAGGEMAKVWAGTGFAQVFGTTGDAVSEGIVQTKLEDGAALQRLTAPKGAENDPEQAGALAALLAASGSEVTAAGASGKRGEAKATDASKIVELLGSPAKGADVPGAKGSALPAGSAATELPGKIGELASTDAASMGKGIEKERDPAKLDAIETKVEQVEQTVEGSSSGAAKKKPSMFKRFGSWLADKAMGLKGRLARAIAKAKASLMGFAAKLFGVSDQFKDLTQDAPLAQAEGKDQVELAKETAAEAGKASSLLARVRAGR